MDAPQRLSISQMRTWLRCPRQWGYRYLNGLKEPPAWRKSAGTGMDKSLEAHNLGKMVGKPMNLSTLQDYYREQVHKVADTEGLPKGEEMASAVDDGVKVLPVYMTTLDPAINPLAVQKEVRADIDGVSMLGYIDLVRDAAGEKVVSDYKFTGKKPTGAATSSMQLAFYAMAEGDVRMVDLIALVRTKSPQVVTDSHFPTEDNRRRLRQMVKTVARGIASKVYPMASPENEYGNGSSTFCHPDKCGYWKRCAGNPKGPEPIVGEEV